MKNQIVLSTLSLISSIAFAQNQNQRFETVAVSVSNLKHKLTAQLNVLTVRCLEGDYGARSLKISLSALKELTVFRHTTRGETEPCINAGFCVRENSHTPGLTPDLILDPSRPSEDIEVNVKLEEILNIDHDMQLCRRSLSETVTSTVRGLDFKHKDGASLGNLDYQVCLKMKEKNI